MRERALPGRNGHCQGNASSSFMFLELSCSSFSKQGVLQLHQCSTCFGSSEIPPHRQVLALPWGTVVAPLQ